MLQGRQDANNVADEDAPSSTTQVSTNTYALNHILYVMIFYIYVIYFILFQEPMQSEVACSATSAYHIAINAIAMYEKLSK
jgi:hypothetical protein